ncbi:tRNA (guanine-N1)-methyltransferase [Fervidicella metallireducens AeB]|uniref:tRNA (guanine-N(1)-)-methyltransferase n=1 Tax=Fervidicella metallireducens AeB TaxID=1403537 RepID=A0A017RXK6_9CLOT|nr:tRNA (guanosine(37)-N1)-methyltransferase TrmD [Fervidicella metallireducens]EYE89321.1 tRNA (guanine-N1)-methyltransferase [Fervidicella metallireducens AeB]
MKFDVLTLFPEMFQVFEHSIIKRAKDKGILNINPINIRDYSGNKHKKVDDYPYGGGPGMVMQAEPIYNVVEALQNQYGYKPFTILMTPRGRKYNQNIARELSSKEHVLLICGHYEGIDERIMPLVDDEISLGDFVLTGGEIAAMAVIDSVSRLVPGVLSCNESYEDESFYNSLLEYPQYTRPEVYKGMKVPEVLLSGHHKLINEWRKYQSLKITYEKRPDLINKTKLSKEELKILDKIKKDLDVNVDK